MKFVALFLILIANSLLADDNLLQSGPMLGYSEYQEVVVWVQTKSEAEVFLKYFDADKKEFQTDRIQTEKSNAYTAHFIIGSLLPGKTYNYELFINNKKVTLPYELKFKTQKLIDNEGNYADFRVITGSGAYINESYFDRPGKPYGGEYEIYKSMAEVNADLMVWLGDNVYLREADWYSKSGMLARYTHSRSLPELQKLLSSAHHYAIWDDHDYGPNDSDRGFRDKKDALEVFKLFWGNLQYGLKNNPGAYFKFTYQDVEFFMLDNRYYRSPTDRRTGNQTMLGEVQLKWLLESLASSTATFKIVTMGGEFLSTEQTHEFYAQYPAERQEILDFVINEQIEGVLFLNGDVHYSDLCQYKPKNFYPLLDFTVSPFTSGVFAAGCEKNEPLRIEGTCVPERNFGVIDVSGKRGNRNLRLAIYDKNARLIWEKNFNQQFFTINGN